MKSNIDINLVKLQNELQKTFTDFDEKQITKRLFEKDTSLWTNDEEVAAKISNRLGWLDLPNNANELIGFANQVKEENFRFVVLLGMGGSSLCSEVAKQTFGSAFGYPELLVLDNTSPTAILNLERNINIKETLFIVASKSGNTMETISFFRYFYEQLQKQNVSNPGNNFIAITDAETPLIDIAKQYNFKQVFINPSDIGGRYSVLSNFGLLPMALIGIDIKSMLENAEQLKLLCKSTPSKDNNPAINLGIALGIAYQNNIDKITFVLSSSIQSFGLWVEQLIAESTGKHGKGLIPISGELLETPEKYGNDRIFIHMYLEDDDNATTFKKLEILKEKGFPIISIKLKDKLDIVAEFYRWEIATAIVAVTMEINPFDEPNVAEGKKNTNDLLDKWKLTGKFDLQIPIFKQDDIRIYGDENSFKKRENLQDIIATFINQKKDGDYLAILAYFEDTEKLSTLLQSKRMLFRDKLKAATTIGYGPRYLHSTGQLHKGGADNGLYIIITSDITEDVEIPGEKFSFRILHQAQSLGDFQCLKNKGRRVIYINLGQNIDENLEEIYNELKKV